MRFKNAAHWDDFIYGLIYPGFLGSMIYDLIVATSDTKERVFIIIKSLITLFYCLDFLHLYTDMKVVPEDKRPLRYFLADIFTSAILFISFIKIESCNYPWILLILLSAIPWFIRWYKIKNYSDKVFFGWFGSLTMFVSIAFIFLHYILGNLSQVTIHIYLALLLFLMFVTYLYYVFIYYNRFSHPKDIEIYGKG